MARSPSPFPRHRLFALLVAAAGIGAAATGAHAQRLNFGGPSAPPPGESPGTIALKRTLSGPAPNPIGREWVPDHRLGELTRARTNTLAAALIARAEELGEAGSVHYAHAALLLHGSEWMDELVRASREPGTEGHQLGAAVRTSIHGIDEALQRTGGKVPPTVGELDVLLRSLFAPLAEACAHRLPQGAAGWHLPRVPAAAAPPAPSTADLRALLETVPAGAMDSRTLLELRAMLDVLDAAAGLWAFEPEAHETRTLIGAAVPLAMGLPGSLPDWFAEAPRARIAAHTDSALRAFAATARDREAAETLAAATAIASLAHRADVLAPTGVRESLSFRLALCDAAADAMGEPGPARDRGRKALRALDRALDLLADRAMIGADADVARELRVSFRALDAAAKKTEAQLVGQLGPIARAESATSEPAILAAIAAHRRALDDLKMLRAVDALLSRHKDDKSPTWRLATTRLLRLGQEIGRAEAADSSLVALRAFAAAIELLDTMPGEESLRAGAADIAVLAGDKAAPLVARLDEWRAGFLEAWSREGDGAPGTSSPGSPGRASPRGGSSDDFAARLRLLRTLLTLIEDARTVRGLAAGGAPREGLLAWPGLPLSKRGLAFAGGGDELVQQLQRAATLAIEPAQTDAARRAVREIETARPTLRLLAELDRGARARGARWVWPFAVAASPPTRGAWLIGERGRLASIARYLDDAANAPPGDEREIAATMAYVDSLARQVLEAGLDR